jgi:hypothetical protein
MSAANGNSLHSLVRCSHKRITITEYITCTSEHIREDDGTWWHNNEPGDYNCRLDVICKDCGLERTYWRYNKRNPKWLRKAMEELGWL